MRDDGIWAIYRKHDEILRKYRPNQYWDAIWATYRDLGKHIKYHLHLTDWGETAFPH